MKIIEETIRKKIQKSYQIILNRLFSDQGVGAAKDFWELVTQFLQLGDSLDAGPDNVSALFLILDLQVHSYT